MGTILEQMNNSGEPEPEARCPVCGAWNARLRYCRHVRWTFDQGDPIEFARFALETSTYKHPRGHRSRDIPQGWWQEHGEYILERVLQRFHAEDGYVFGELAELDLLTLDIWRAFEPEPTRAPIPRQ